MIKRINLDKILQHDHSLLKAMPDAYGGTTIATIHFKILIMCQANVPYIPADWEEDIIVAEKFFNSRCLKKGKHNGRSRKRA